MPAPPPPPPAPLPGGRLAAALVAHHRLLLGALLLAVFVALRLAYLDADPPVALPNDVRVYELFTDPPAKSYEARNWALFGTWSTSPADNYQFWRLQAPVWVYALAGFYRLFGVGYLQMRVFSTLCSATGLVALLALAGQRLRGLPYLVAGAFLTGNVYHVVYSRSGLLETLLNTFVILTILFLHLARSRLLWLLAAEGALVLGFLTKQTGLYLLPVFLVAAVLAYRRAAGAPRRERLLPVAQAALLLAFLAWYVLRPAYLRTVTWNYGHMLFDNGALTRIDLRQLPLAAAVRRLFAGRTWSMGFFSLFPLAGLLSLLEVARVLRAALARRALAWELLVVAWLLAGLGTLLLTPFLWVHYRLILFPPVVLLAASFLDAVLRLDVVARRPRLGPALAVGALLLELGVQGRWLSQLRAARTYHLREATALVRRHVGDEGAVFAGVWAGPLVFDTRHRYYYIKEIFNTSGAAMASFGLTHLFEVDPTDMVNMMLAQKHPSAMADRRLLATFPLRGHTVRLHQLRTPISHATLVH
jgi:4-amino-4-deoxy-L-arabinose transferase-like glycosyltransferase